MRKRNNGETAVSTVNNERAVVKLTVVETEADGGIISMDGALSCFNRNDVTVNLHKRYAVVKTRLLGEERSLVFGIQLKRRLMEKKESKSKN